MLWRVGGEFGNAISVGSSTCVRSKFSRWRVSDELPKASSKERGGGGKVIFFFENLSLVPETRQVMEHFKLVFGSGTSDLAKIRPLKNWTSWISWKSSLFGNFHPG